MVSALPTGMTIDHLFEEALASAEPMWELRGVVRGLLADGHDRAVLLGDLELFQMELRRQERDDAEDVVLDVMDFVAGWSSPHMKL